MRKLRKKIEIDITPYHVRNQMWKMSLLKFYGTIEYDENIYNEFARKLLDNKIIDAFNKSYFKSKGNRRGVGFDKPQLTGNHQSTCGCVSEKSFGHSGHTGTYAWADPDKEIIIVILANRTYPNDDKTFSEKNIRTRIQEYVYEALIN